MEYRATITTPCEEHKSHTVTITGDGAEVWGVAESAIQVLESNKVAVVVHFYKNNEEVPWQRELDTIHLGFALDDLLKGSGFRVDIADLPF